MNKTIIWILVVVVVIVGIVLLGGGKGNVPEDNLAPTGDTPVENGSGEGVMTQPATGNIDDAVNSILSEASADSEAPTDADPSLTTPEDFSGLDQTLDTSNIQ